jgi:thymidine phosphorylase
MVALSGIESSLGAARARVNDALASGAALELFRRNVEAQGGDPRVCDEPARVLGLTLEEARVESARAGYVTGIDAAELGRALASIGGGRARVEDEIDPAVGYLAEAGIGDRVGGGQALGLLYCRDPSSAARATARIRAAYTIGEEPPARLSELIKEVIT